MSPIIGGGSGSPHEPLEPIVLLLFAGMVLFTVALFAAEAFFKSDGQMFQVVAGLLAGFSGAFFMRVKGGGPPADGGVK